MNAPTLEHVTDQVTGTVHDVAHQVADRAPDFAAAVGRNARSTAETVGHTVTDAVVKLAQLTPFLDAPAPRRHRARWLVGAALVATIVGIAMWMRRRCAAEPRYDVGEPTSEQTDLSAGRRYATAGH